MNALLSNAIIFHNVPDIIEIARLSAGRRGEGRSGGLAQIAPYLTEHMRRFGQYSTHELADGPDAYDPRPDVDFTPIRGDGPPADGFGQAA